MVHDTNGFLSRHPLLLLVPATFFQGYDILVVSLALPLIRQHFHLTIEQSGFLVSIIFSGSFGVLILLPLSDRYGRKPILTVTIIGYTVATFLTAFSRGMVDFAIYQIISHAFLASEDVLSVIMVVELTNEDRRGRALAILASAAVVGQAAAGGGFLAVFALHGSWRLLYLVSVPPLILVVFARRGLSETLVPGPRSRNVLGGLNGKVLVGSGILSFCIALFPGAVTALASTLVFDVWKFTLDSIKPYYYAVWLAGASGFFVAGRMLDRIGRRHTSAIFFMAAAVAGLICFNATATWQRVLGLAFVIFTMTGSTPCFQAFSTELFPSAVRGSAGALLQGVSLGGTAAAPALAAVLSRPAGGIGPALGIVGFSYAVAAAAVLILLPETLVSKPALLKGGDGTE
jgi:MFS family permease